MKTVQSDGSLNVSGVNFPAALLAASDSFSQALTQFREAKVRVENCAHACVASEVAKNGSGTPELTGYTFVNDKFKKLLWQNTGCEQTSQALLSEKQLFFQGLKSPDINKLAAKYDHFEDAAKLHFAASYVGTRDWIEHMKTWLSPKEIEKDKAKVVMERILEFYRAGKLHQIEM